MDKNKIIEWLNGTYVPTLESIILELNSKNSTFCNNVLCYDMELFAPHVNGMETMEVICKLNPGFSLDDDLFNVDEYGKFSSLSREQYEHVLFSLVGEIAEGIMDSPELDYPEPLKQLIK